MWIFGGMVQPHQSSQCTSCGPFMALSCSLLDKPGARPIRNSDSAKLFDQTFTSRSSTFRTPLLYSEFLGLMLADLHHGTPLERFVHQPIGYRKYFRPTATVHREPAYGEGC